MKSPKITNITSEDLDDLKHHVHLGKEFLDYKDTKVILELIRREEFGMKMRKFAIENGMIFCSENKEG